MTKRPVWMQSILGHTWSTVEQLGGSSSFFFLSLDLITAATISRPQTRTIILYSTFYRIYKQSRPETMEMIEVGHQIWRILIGHQFFFALLVQAFFLHPCYRESSWARWVRLILLPLTTWLSLSSISIRQWEPIEENFHFNFIIVSFSSFHAICLTIEFGTFKGSIMDCPRSQENQTEQSTWSWVLPSKS